MAVILYCVLTGVIRNCFQRRHLVAAVRLAQHCYRETACRCGPGAQIIQVALRAASTGWQVLLVDHHGGDFQRAVKNLIFHRGASAGGCCPCGHQFVRSAGRETRHRLRHRYVVAFDLAGAGCSNTCSCPICLARSASRRRRS